MLQIKNLNAGYGELHILKGISLEVKPKEIVALIGPNGAGKSTIIKSIFNIADIRNGLISFNHKKIKGLKSYDIIKHGISYVNQGKIIFTNLTVRENLTISPIHANKHNVSQQLKHVYNLFPVLKQKQNQLAYGLSGGQQQQLALGRALMEEPELLLLDEPSLGLSPILQKQLFKTIVKLKENISVLIVEQNAKQAIAIADRTYLLEDGNIVLTGGKDIINHKIIKNVYLGGR